MTSGTLREYIRKLSTPNLKIVFIDSFLKQQVKRWARQILKGLSYLHSHDPPIIHRDIKPANIFKKQNSWKLGDFGFSMIID